MIKIEIWERIIKGRKKKKNGDEMIRVEDWEIEIGKKIFLMFNRKGDEMEN